MKKLLLIATLALALTGAFSGSASAHSCIWTTDANPRTGINELYIYVYWQCGLGTGTAGITMRLMKGVGGQWVQFKSYSKTITIGATYGSTWCRFAVTPTNPPNVYASKITVVHHNTITFWSPSVRYY